MATTPKRNKNVFSDARDERGRGKRPESAGVNIGRGGGQQEIGWGVGQGIKRGAIPSIRYSVLEVYSFKEHSIHSNYTSIKVRQHLIFKVLQKIVSKFYFFLNYPNNYSNQNSNVNLFKKLDLKFEY